jgi:hypothetical protein
MNKWFALLLAFLCAPWICAQTTQSSAHTSQSPQTSIRGCLKGSNGNYTLTDKSGTTYLLTGNTASLQDHAGQKMALTGTVELKPAGTRASNETSSNPSEPTSPKTFNVSSSKSLDAVCSVRH